MKTIIELSSDKSDKSSKPVKKTSKASAAAKKSENLVPLCADSQALVNEKILDPLVEDVVEEKGAAQVKKNKAFSVSSRVKSKDIPDGSANGEKMTQSSYSGFDVDQGMVSVDANESFEVALTRDVVEHEEDYEDSEQDSYFDGEGNQVADTAGVTLAANQALLTLSYSLMSQVKQVARLEGVSPGDILIELIAEGVTKRAFQDMSRPTPSHLMTRTGYVPPDLNGNQIAQPSMSHHQQLGNGQARNGNQKRFQQNGNSFFAGNGNGRGNGNSNANGRFANGGNQRSFGSGFNKNGNRNQKRNNGHFPPRNGLNHKSPQGNGGQVSSQQGVSSSDSEE